VAARLAARRRLPSSGVPFALAMAGVSTAIAALTSWLLERTPERLP
jgi:hypothetical protein